MSQAFLAEALLMLTPITISIPRRMPPNQPSAIVEIQPSSSQPQIPFVEDRMEQMPAYIQYDGNMVTPQGKVPAKLRCGNEMEGAENIPYIGFDVMTPGQKSELLTGYESIGNDDAIIVSTPSKDAGRRIFEVIERGADEPTSVKDCQLDGDGNVSDCKNGKQFEVVSMSKGLVAYAASLCEQAPAITAPVQSSDKLNELKEERGDFYKKLIDNLNRLIGMTP